MHQDLSPVYRKIMAGKPGYLGEYIAGHEFRNSFINNA